VSAQDIHRQVSEALLAHFPLEMDGRTDEPPAMWDVLIAAAAERLTIAGASELLEAAPGPNSVRQVLRGLLPGNGLAALALG
jgi:hypothetical protein